MAGMRNYENSLYNQFEEINKKLDKANNTISNMSLTISTQADEIKKLNNELKKANETIEKLLKERDKYKNQSNKNSSNSSKPSSTDIFKPRKSGANLYNSRQKTGKKQGGQKGHKGHGLSKDKIESIIKEGKAEVIETEHVIKGDDKKEPTIKFKVGMKTITYIEKHTFRYSKKANGRLPKEFYTDVTYTNEFKALIVFMNVHNVMSMKRLTEFIRELTNGIISLSEGSVVNILSEFSNKSTLSIDNIVEDLVKGTELDTDETGQKVENRNGAVRNYSNTSSVVYKSHFNKGHAPIELDNILPNYLGVVMGDHDTTLDKYGTKRIECNVHLGRYTVEITQNTFEAPWAEKMKTLLDTGNETRKYAQAYGLTGFDAENYEWYSKKFEEIISEAKEETKKIKSSFYRDKSKTLYKRLEKNKEKHLAYLKDFSLSYSNNISENDLRIYKIKIKVSGSFRSKKGSDCFADALSIIKTSLKRKENILSNILDIFNGKVLFQN